ACRSVGHRHDSEHLWQLTTGRVRQLGRLETGYFWAGKRMGVGAPVVMIQSPIEAGESGSALLDHSGKVIGVVSAVANRVPGTAIAIDASAVRGLLADARKQAPAVPGPVAEAASPVRMALRATIWVRPQSTERSAAGVIIDLNRRLALTSAAAVGADEVVDLVAPRWDANRLVAESAAYADLLGLRLSGHCVRAAVLARDPGRELALLQLESAPKTLDALTVADGDPRAGDRVDAVSHPVGVELRWLASAGTVRSIGKVALQDGPGNDVPRPNTAILQLPHLGSSSGGPVVNARGELVGILAAREGPRQELAYAAATAEVLEFLRGARPLAKPATAAEWYGLAQLAVRGRLPEMALAAFDEAAKLAPSDPEILARYAIALQAYKPERIDRARELTRQAAGVSGRKPAADAAVAEAFRVLGDRDAATRHVEAALKADAKLVAALVTRARLVSGREAARDLDEALDLDPSCADAYCERAALQDVTTTEGRQRALADLGRAIELQPRNVNAIARRGQLFLESKEFKKAVADFARLTEIEPLNSSSWESLSRAQLLLGDEAAATASLVALIRIEPGKTGRAFAAIRARAAERLADDPGNGAAVVSWFERSLTGVRPVLPTSERKRVDGLLDKVRREADLKKQLALLEAALAEWQERK
ncbi:MAG TPA: trypsin-like peptidase domain-containing protein, partial [Gemmataceae bacterium]|nr:trypsin-like peptidase domain-containing protein [Gemmataceae bacterium]